MLSKLKTYINSKSLILQSTLIKTIINLIFKYSFNKKSSIFFYFLLFWWHLQKSSLYVEIGYKNIINYQIYILWCINKHINIIILNSNLKYTHITNRKTRVINLKRKYWMIRYPINIRKLKFINVMLSKRLNNVFILQNLINLI